MGELVLAVKDGKWVVESGEAAGDPPAPTENLELGQLDIARQISNIEIGGVDAGTAVLGGTVALLVSEVTDGFMRRSGGLGSNGATTRVVVKFVEAWAILQFGSQWIGKPAAELGAAFLAFDGLRAAVPIDDWIRRVTRAISGEATGTEHVQGDNVITLNGTDQGPLNGANPVLSRMSTGLGA